MPNKTVLEFLNPGARTLAAKEGLRKLGALSQDDAYGLMLDTIVRQLLPQTLDEVPRGLVSEKLREEAGALLVCSRALREQPALPQSLPRIRELFFEVQRILGRVGTARFLGSLQGALTEPADLKFSGALYMALYRWPSCSSSGHINWSGQDFEGTCCSILELIGSRG